MNWIEMVVAYFYVMSRNFPGCT